MNIDINLPPEILQPTSAIDLTIKGTMGSFNVGSSTGCNSIEVRYLLSHVSLDFEHGQQNDRLLTNLMPVREIWDMAKLTFAQIMQRDIDDARVSNDLIPYLLDTTSRDLIKLFPPIIVAVLPTTAKDDLPQSFYPKVSDNINGIELNAAPFKRIIRSGGIGSEVFEFEFYMNNAGISYHDQAKLKINTQLSKLVIIDGQHRAMALLALHRNLKNGWQRPSQQAFREYYAHWTANLIKKFNLNEIHLPIMLCTFPGLDVSYNAHSPESPANVINACREVFLALNKNARPVSNSRNILLDDSDLVSHCLRHTLEDVKEAPFTASQLRIHHFELDQVNDRTTISTPVAISGVNHVFFIIEHLLFNERADIQGIRNRKGYYSRREDLQSYGTFNRLGCIDRMGTDLAFQTTRRSLSNTAIKILTESFNNTYGVYMLKFFKSFKPFCLHMTAVENLRNTVNRDPANRLTPILFDGQGIGRVFDEHRSKLKSTLSDGKIPDSPEIHSILRDFEQTKTRLSTCIEDFKKDRAELFCLSANIAKKTLGESNKDKLEKFYLIINRLFQSIYFSIAFQTSVICTFFEIIERAKIVNIEVIEQLFDEYLNITSLFFAPKTEANLKKLIKIFEGEPSGEFPWDIIAKENTFYHVVSHGEMQPEAWPRYRAFLLELWKTSDDHVQAVIEQEKQVCRKQIFKKLFEEKKIFISSQENIALSDFSQNQEAINKSFDLAKKTYLDFLKNIGYSTAQCPSEDLLKVFLEIESSINGEKED